MAVLRVSIGMLSAHVRALFPLFLPPRARRHSHAKQPSVEGGELAKVRLSVFRTSTGPQSARAVVRLMSATIPRTFVSLSPFPSHSLLDIFGFTLPAVVLSFSPGKAVSRALPAKYKALPPWAGSGPTQRRSPGLIRSLTQMQSHR